MPRPFETGQTLTELALVLPVFCFMVWMSVMLWIFCNNMIESQRLAQVASDLSAKEAVTQTRPYNWTYRLDRTARTTVRLKRQTMPLPAARSFRGFSTLSTPIRLVRFEVDSVLVPGSFFGRWLGMAAQGAASETVLDPMPPKEG